MSGSPSPARAHFANAELKHLAFDFHRPAELNEIEAVLRLRPERAPLLLVVGDKGIGRRYLIQSAVLRRRRAGVAIRYAGIDLDGFEPGQDESDFAKYLNHLGAKNQCADTARWREFATWIGESKIKLSVRTAALVSIALESSLSLKELASIFRDGAVIEGPLYRESEAFARQMSAIAGDSSLVVHVDDLEATPGILIEWLSRLAARDSKFYIAFSGSRHAGNMLPSPVRRVELFPLERHEVRPVIDERFSPNRLPDYLCDLLHQYGEGWPSLMAAKMADLVATGLVTCAEDDCWRLRESTTSEDLADNLSDSILDWFRRVVAKAPAPWKPAVENTVRIASLCGACIPIRRLAEFQGFDRDQQDELLGLLDRLFAQDRLFDDYEYAHPGFPGELIYSFANPVIPHALRKGMRLPEREELATRLVQFLSDRISRRTRGQARLYLHLASEADLSQLSKELRRELEWFAGVEDAEALTSMLRSRVLEGSLAPNLLIKVERLNRDRWLPVMRLAVLDALCQPSAEGRSWDTIGMPSDLLRTFLTSHAEALLAAGFYDAAYDRVCAAVAAEGESTLLQNLRGGCSLEIGDYRGAERDFRGVITALSRDQTSGQDLLAAKNNLAVSLRQLGEYEEARTLALEVLEACTRLLGAEHPATLTAKANLAASLSQVGEYEEARRLISEVLEALTRLLGAEHPQTLTAKNNLVASLSQLGEFEEARKSGSEVLEALTRLLGAEHPQTVTAKAQLAASLSQLGEYEEARKLGSEVLKARTRLLGAEHPQTVTAKTQLAASLRQLGEYEEARTLGSEALEALTRLLGAEHPETLRAKAQLAVSLSQLGENDEARKFKSEVLEARTRLLGAEHLDTLTAEGNLAVSLRQLGEYEEARKLESEVLEALTRLLGAEHPETLTAKNNLAVSLRQLGEYEEARKLGSEVVEARTRVLGAEHPETLTAKANLAAGLSQLGEYEEAWKLESEVLEARTWLLGVEHPDTLRAKANLADSLNQLGKPEEARKLGSEVLEALTRLLGAEHPKTLRAKAHLASLSQPSDG